MKQIVELAKMGEFYEEDIVFAIWFNVTYFVKL